MSIITFCCVCLTVILSCMATLVAYNASSYFVGKSALLSCRDCTLEKHCFCMTFSSCTCMSEPTVVRFLKNILAENWAA